MQIRHISKAECTKIAGFLARATNADRRWLLPRENQRSLCTHPDVVHTTTTYKFTWLRSIVMKEMEGTEHNVCAEEISKHGTGGDSNEEDGKKLDSEAATTTCQDSGLSSGRDAALTGPPHTPKKVTAKSHSSRGKTLSPCLTSTPKKKLFDLAEESNYAIISSQAILEDPLLSSIDEPGNSTDYQAESLTSDEDSEDAGSRLCKTKVKAESDASQRKTPVYKLVNDLSNTRISTSQSFSETIQQHVVEANPASVKKNLFDIPVSPKLKNRVRERLYTLVNSIEGYENRVYVRDEETSGQIHNMESFSKVNIKSPKSTKNGVNTFSKLPVYSSSDVSTSQQNCFHDLSNASALGSSLMERYGCALSGVITSQIKSLQHHQDQLNQEKLSLAMQKKEQETSARISLYHEKLQLMIQMVEELELRSVKHQAAARDQAEHHNQRMKEQEEQHQEELAALRAECHRKIEEARVQTQLADRACEQRLLEVISATQVKSAALEKELKAQISDLNSSITRLRAEKRVLEASLETLTSDIDRTHLVSGSPSPQGGREAGHGEHSKQTDNMRRDNGLYKDLSGDLLKTRSQEEVRFWKKESEQFQKKLHEAEVMQRELIGDMFQVDHEVLGVQSAGESEELRSTVAVLQEKLSQALKENVALKQKLNDCHERETDLMKKLALKEDEVTSLRAELKFSKMQVLQGNENLELQLKECAEHHKQTMVSYQCDVERETSAAVTAALAHHREKTHHLLADLGARYELLIRSTRAHSRAQINEYKKAVRCLKERNKMMEKG
ncbi:myosin heavy chain, striated muscle-like isoform X2 [Scylla paramamosain]|uniref:myosin heavy chain, striated muscle-like isoform X2 n=1 Tax=Scylla paramamosain TaxID=85552 RepID=UPI003083ABD1